MDFIGVSYYDVLVVVWRVGAGIGVEDDRDGHYFICGESVVFGKGLVLGEE